MLNFNFLFQKRENERTLPKFGDWDVNDPASAEKFSVIFKRARDEKKSGRSTQNLITPQRSSDNLYKNESYYEDYPRYRRRKVIS